MFEQFLQIFNTMLTTYAKIKPDEQPELIDKTIHGLSALINEQYKETNIMITEQMLIDIGNLFEACITTHYETSLPKKLHLFLGDFFAKFYDLNPGIILKTQISCINNKPPYIIEVLDHHPTCTINQLATVQINRKNANYVIINGSGKKQITNCQKQQINLFLEKDCNYQTRLTEKSHQCFDVNCNHLRWASGGCIIKVELNNEYYVAVHYRDIEPYGWNVFLGSSGLDETGKILEREFNYPSELAFRETAEELLIVNENPNQAYNEHTTLKYYPYFLDIKHKTYNSTDYCQEHLKLRHEYDHLSFSQYDPKKLSIAPTGMQVLVEDGNNDQHLTRNVLFCFDLLAKGIEIVKVVELQLNSSDYLLNGEIIDHKHYRELARTPIALIPYAYINNYFKNINNIEPIFNKTGQIETYRITQTSDDTEKNFKEQLKFFNYDIQIRKDIVLGKTKGTGEEVHRYSKGFEEHFNMDNCMLRDEKYLCFTPATVKLFNLLNYYI